MKKLSNTEAELKKSVAYKKSVYFIGLFSVFQDVINSGNLFLLIDSEHQ